MENVWLVLVIFNRLLFLMLLFILMVIGDILLYLSFFKIIWFLVLVIGFEINIIIILVICLCEFFVGVNNL